MKKVVFLILCTVLGHAFAQQPVRSCVYKDTVTNVTVTVNPNWIRVGDINKLDVKLYDSYGNLVREFKGLWLQSPEEEVAYRIIFRFLTEKDGQVQFGKIIVPCTYVPVEENFENL